MCPRTFWDVFSGSLIDRNNSVPTSECQKFLRIVIAYAASYSGETVNLTLEMKCLSDKVFK